MKVAPQRPVAVGQALRQDVGEGSLLGLPSDLQARIAQYLPTASLWALTSTSTALGRLTQRPDLCRDRLAPYAGADRLGADSRGLVRRLGVAPFDSPLGQTYQREVHQRFLSLILSLAVPVVGVVECLHQRSVTAPVTVAAATIAAILWHPYAVPPAILALACFTKSVLSWHSAAALGLGLWCHGPTLWTRWRAKKQQPSATHDAWQADNLRVIKQALMAPNGATDGTRRKALAVSVALQTSLSRTLQHLARVNDVTLLGEILALCDDAALRTAVKTDVEFQLDVLHEATVKPMAWMASRRPQALVASLRGRVEIAESFLAAVRMPPHEVAQLNWQAEKVYPAVARMLTPQEFPSLHRHFGWAACRLLAYGTPTADASATRLLSWLSRPDLVRDTEGCPVLQIIDQLAQSNLARRDIDIELDGTLTHLKDSLRTIEHEAQQVPSQNAIDHRALALLSPQS